MQYNLITNIESCYVTVPHLLYFSHIPTALIALFLGLFVYFKNRDALVAKILLFISLAFSLWAALDISMWLEHDSRLIMFSWSIVNLVEMLVSASTLYFSYVFLSKKDLQPIYKMIIGTMLLVFAVLVPTSLNISGFDITNCEATQGNLTYYFYSLEILFLLVLVIYLIQRIFTTAQKDRKMTVLFSIGVFFFLASFSGANILGSFTENWQILQYGLFGMPVFMAFLAYLIVQYKVFDIKLFTANVLVVGIAILIASQYFFIQNPTNRILNGITLSLVIIFGWWLASSVRREIEQKEKLAVLAKELESANDHLKEVDKLKDDFLSMASHELNTPIAAIEGYLSMILVEGLGGKIPDKARGYLESVFKSSQRLANMVKDLLNVSRIESNRIHVVYEEKQVEEIINQAILEVASKAREAKHTLTFDEPKHKMPTTWLDVTRITEVLINMLGNSIKYTDPGGKIKVGCVTDGDKIVVSVADNGKGIPKDRHHVVFEKFSQVDVMKDQVKGTGLGMYISQKFVELHKGKIWFHSDGADKGTTFFFSLPILTKKPYDAHEGEGQVLH
jgi:signal transduction histidine kinase